MMDEELRQRAEIIRTFTPDELQRFVDLLSAEIERVQPTTRERFNTLIELRAKLNGTLR